MDLLLVYMYTYGVYLMVYCDMRRLDLFCLLLMMLGRVFFLISEKKDDTQLTQTIIVWTLQESIQQHTSADSVSNNDVSSDVSTPTRQPQETMPLHEYNSHDIQDIAVLQAAYTQTQDTQVGIALVQALSQSYRFNEALDLINVLRTKDERVIDPLLHLYVLQNSNLLSATNEQSIKILSDMVGYYQTKSLISNDDATFYAALIKLWTNDFYGAKILFEKIQSPTYTQIKNSLLEVYSNVATMRDMPLHYGTALFSLTLMKNGYFGVAKKLALQILTKDPDYILPYQILAYAHFLTHNWEPAISYALTLRDLEPSASDRYAFMIGVSYYRLGDYEQSVLYLQQVQERSLRLDTDRYLLLNYIAVNDTVNMISTWQKILGNNTIAAEDFYTYFFHVFYEPLRTDKPHIIYNTNNNLAFLYITQCFKTLGSEHSDICEYGNAWLQFVQKNYSDAETILLTLANKYDEPYIHVALGDYYKRNNNIQDAQKHYLLALWLQNDDTFSSDIQQKIYTLQP